MMIIGCTNLNFPALEKGRYFFGRCYLVIPFFYYFEVSFRRIYITPSQYTSACIYACHFDPHVLVETYKYGQWTSHMPMTPYEVYKTHRIRSFYKIVATNMTCLNLVDLNNYN